MAPTLRGGPARQQGRTVALDGFTYTVVGVLPASFELDLPTLPREIDLWKVPDAWWQNGDVWSGDSLSAGVLQFVARRRTDASEAEARQQLAAFAERERGRQVALAAAGFDLRLEALHAFIVHDATPMIAVVFGAVVCVLLIACANVMNLLLVRAHARRRELAVRVALGSSPARLVRLLLVESAVLGVIGGGIGCAAAVYGVRLLLALRPANLPRAAQISVDGSALAFAALTVLACPLIFGALPALRVNRWARTDDLRHSGGTGSDRVRIGRAVAAGQLAVSIILLVAAALLGTSLVRLESTQPGFETAHAITFSVSLPGTRYHRPDGTGRFMRTLERQIAALPEVRAVGTIWPLPLSGRRWSGAYIVGADPAGPHGLADYRLASGGVFDALGTRILDGRPFVPQESRDVVIVSRSFARAAWPNETALGRVVQAAPWGGAPTRFEVVGVSDDVRAQSLRAPAQPALYFDSQRWSWTDWEMPVVVRTAGDPATMSRAVRSELAGLDATIPMAQVRLMTDYVADDLAANRFALELVGAFTAVALALAVVGLYGVVSYAVGQRTREFGVRIALGAERSSIVRLVLGEGLRMASISAGLGLLGALWITPALESMLLGTEPLDPATFAAAASVLIAVTMVACYLPARRASRVEPLEILRAE